MDMGKNVLQIKVSWTENNFGCAWYDEQVGSVVATNKSLDYLKKDFKESLELHIKGCVADGDKVPEYLVRGDYELNFELDTAALIHDAVSYTTLAVISRASGINQRQLSHYANGIKKARPAQRERIVKGLKLIGSQILALC